MSGHVSDGPPGGPTRGPSQTPFPQPPPWATAHLRPGEAALWWAKPSRFGLAPIGISTLAGALAIGATAYYGVDRPGALFTGLPALVLAVGGLLIELGRQVMRLLFASYVITDERLYVITSFIETDVRTVPLARVSRVTLRQGPLARMFGLWTARVAAYGEGRSSVQVQAIRDGDGLLRETSAGMTRSARADWLVRGD